MRFISVIQSLEPWGNDVDALLKTHVCWNYLHLNRLKKLTNAQAEKQHNFDSIQSFHVELAWFSDNLSDSWKQADLSLSFLFVLRGCCFFFVPVELILVCSLQGLCAVCQLNLFPTPVLSSSAKKLLSQTEERGALSLLNSRGAAGNVGERKLFVTRSLGLIAGSCALSLAPVCLRHLFFTVAVKMG